MWARTRQSRTNKCTSEFSKANTAVDNERLLYKKVAHTRPKTLKTWEEEEEEEQLSFKWVGLFVVCGRRFIKARILQRVVSHGNASAWKQDDLLTTGSVRAQEAGNGHKQITWILDVSCHIAPKIQSGQRSLVNNVNFILLKMKLVLLNPADTSG